VQQLLQLKLWVIKKFVVAYVDYKQGKYIRKKFEKVKAHLKKFSRIKDS
jgi:hypothetical protein